MGWYVSLSESLDATDFAFPLPLVGVLSSSLGGSTSVDSRSVRMLVAGGRALHASPCHMSCSSVRVRSALVI